MPRFEPQCTKVEYDKHLLLDLWQACKPDFDEHILAFTINFSDTESKRLKETNEKYVSYALQSIKVLLDKAGPIDVIVVVERNRRRTGALSGPKTGLHAHGWVRVHKSMTDKKLKTILKSSQSKKYPRYRAFSVKKDNLRTGKEVDIGWPIYMSKEFGKKPKDCTTPRHWFSATVQTKRIATQIRAKRQKKPKFRDSVFSARQQMIEQLQRTGDWKNWHDVYDYYETVSE